MVEVSAHILWHMVEKEGPSKNWAFSGIDQALGWACKADWLVQIPTLCLTDCVTIKSVKWGNSG